MLKKYIVYRIPTFVLCFFFFLHLPAQALKNYVPQPDSTRLVEKILQEYGADPVLVNGFYPEDNSYDALGHPFLGDNDFFSGYIVVHGRKYDGLSLKYNLSEQNVIVSETGPDQMNYQVIPPNRFISGFQINGRVFRKYHLNLNEDKFFQVMYDGNIKFLRYIYKNRYESYHDLNYISYKFSREKVQSWLLAGEKLQEFRKTGSFINCFPEEIRHDVRAYIKKEKIRINRLTDMETEKLFRYCDEITRKDGRL